MITRSRFQPLSSATRLPSPTARVRPLQLRSMTTISPPESPDIRPPDTTNQKPPVEIEEKTGAERIGGRILMLGLGTSMLSVPVGIVTFSFRTWFYVCLLSGGLTIMGLMTPMALEAIQKHGFFGALKKGLEARFPMKG